MSKNQTLAQLLGMTAEDAEAIAKMGCELASAGRLEEARVLFSGLVAANPHDGAAQAALGTVLHKMGRIEEALAAYRAPSCANSPVALTCLGELALAAGDVTGACMNFAAALKADPKGLSVAAGRARTLLATLKQQPA